MSAEIRSYLGKFIILYEKNLQNISGIYTDYPNDKFILMVINLNYITDLEKENITPEQDDTVII